MDKNYEFRKQDIDFSDWIREFYNKKASNISNKGYEYARWSSSQRKIEQYKFSAQSLIFHLRDVNFKKCLEVGCGPGTWTKLLLKKYPYSRFSCLDISKEMIRQFDENISEKKRVKTIVNNFLDHDFKKEKFDFVFCSRAIEYIPNKAAAISKFYSLMENGGKGVIVSSPPHPSVFRIKKMLGMKVNFQHTKRIFARDILYLLRKVGFRNVKAYPILFSDFFLVPNSFLFRRLYRREWGLLSRIFASSYIVTFEKPQ